MGIAVKYNVIGYLIGEGIHNIFKNMKSALACLGTMCATMILFGVFFAVIENINTVISQVEASQGIEVFIEFNTSQEDIDTLRRTNKKLRRC